MSVRYSSQVRASFIEAVCAGSSVKAAAEMLGVPRGTVRGWWESAGVNMRLQRGRRGGLAAPLPPARAKGGRYLSSEDRAVIQAGLTGRLTLARIGALIGRDKSVISREITRNRGADGVYRAAVADRGAAVERARPKQPKLAANPVLRARVEEGLDQGWSPGLIAAMLARDAGQDQTGRVSHETIYRALYVQGRGLLRQDLARKLSTGRTRRKPHGNLERRGKAIYEHAYTISDRPAEVADRAVPGHWEGDLIMGAGNRSAVGTLVERSTRFVILLHLPGRHTADEVATTMIQQMSALPEHLRRSITWDRGVELADYARIQLALKAPVFFCDPHSPWQRGSNENTNRLLRFWLTKGSDLHAWDAAALQRVQDTLNQRPRPTLDYRTPAQALNTLLNPQVATTT
ncbi:IS30 family transposase [Leifsonia sp. Leaf264]|uniref:IS30 family transposase n=1 Tax=Leifsonia sp. Leaf264 TaxID=1736314 RepID=UPI0006FC97CD|nr:IS30 family transposase [Leifsonia sp. Leaf264]KQP01066.1 integrase [Leifsonia sp. Leaf264]